MIILINKIKKLLKGSAWKLVQNVPRIKKQNKTVIMWDSRDFMRAVFKFMKKLHWSIPHKLHCEIWQNYPPPPIYIYIYIYTCLSWGLDFPVNILYSVTLDGFLTFSEETSLKYPTQNALWNMTKLPPPIYIYIYTSLSWEFLVNILYSVTVDGFLTFSEGYINCEIHVKMKTCG